MYVAQDGERLRSMDAVKSYLLKCGMEQVLDSAINCFDFEGTSLAEGGSSLTPPDDTTGDHSSDAPNSKGKTVVKRKRNAADDDAERTEASGNERHETEPVPEWKLRNRKIAESRAAAFARGQG